MERTKKHKHTRNTKQSTKNTNNDNTKIYKTYIHYQHTSTPLQNIIPRPKYTTNIQIHHFKTMFMCPRSIAGVNWGASGLPSYCTPPVGVPAVIGAFIATLQKKGYMVPQGCWKEKKSSSRNWKSERVEIEVCKNQSLTLGSIPVIPPPCRLIGLSQTLDGPILSW